MRRGEVDLQVGKGGFAFVGPLEVLGVGEKYSMKRLLKLLASRFLPPGSGFLPPASRSLHLGLGAASGFWLPGRVIYPALG